MSFPQVAWLKSQRDVTGQDQLGVRFSSEFIYASLLPGITNVTDRSRYYSFYTWVLWATEKHSGNLKTKPLYEIIRRADCLYTLIGLYHSQSLGKNDALHGGLIGSITLGAALNDLGSDGYIKISKYSAAEENNPKRYFKNKYGGLGQYYLGPLRDAGILDYNSRQELCYTDDKGAPLAESFDLAVDRGRFFAVLEKDSVSVEDLEDLIAFCPCNLKDSEAEQSALLDFFFERDELFASKDNSNRKASLLLLTNFIAESNILNNSVSINADGVHSFLATIYANSPRGESRSAEQKTTQIDIFWRQYYASELLSYAVQSLFWAGLTTLANSDDHPENAAAYGSWLAENFNSSIENFKTQNLNEAIEITKERLPSIEDWSSPDHEIQLAWKIEKITRDRTLPDKQTITIELAIKLLLTLLARWRDADFQDVFPVTLPSGYALNYPINLKSFFQKAATEWANYAINEWLAWLGNHWGVEAHLTVALRKLRHENLDTFKIIPTERGLRVTQVVGNRTISEILMPGFTSPRLRQTLQMLTDLGVLEAADENLKVTPLGFSLLEKNV